MLRADIEDGIVKVPESKRIAMNDRRRSHLDMPEKKNETEKQPAKQEKAAQKTAAVQKKKTPSAKAGPAKKTGKVSVGKAKSQEYLDAMKKGAEAEKAGDLGMALWHFWQAADMDDQSPEAYMALTRIHLKRKEKGSAIKAYQKAVLNGGKRDLKLEETFNQ